MSACHTLVTGWAGIHNCWVSGVAPDGHYTGAEGAVTRLFYDCRLLLIESYDDRFRGL